MNRNYPNRISLPKAGRLALVAFAATLAAGAAAAAAADAAGAEPAPRSAKRILDHELAKLEKVAAKVGMPAEKAATLRRILTAGDATRKGHLTALAAELAAVQAAAGGGGDVEAALAALDARRLALRAQRTEKFDALAAEFDEKTQVAFLAKLARRRAARPRAGRLKSFVMKHLPTLLTKVLDVEAATVAELKAVFGSRADARAALKKDAAEVAAALGAYDPAGDPDSTRAAALLARARRLREAMHAEQDAHLAAARAALSPARRGDLVAKVYAGVRRVAAFAGYFVDLEELKLFR